MDEVDSSLLSALEGRISDEIHPPEEQIELDQSIMEDEIGEEEGLCVGGVINEQELGIQSNGSLSTEAEAEATVPLTTTITPRIIVDRKSVRKRKMSVFAAAGAVIAIQTVLVAMPEIWQPLEDDESAEKVAYQEGLHSWFGALNRAAWVLSATNGSGDGGWWVKPRSGVWFNTFLMNSHDDDRWLRALHMKRKTFLWISNSLEVHVRKQDTKWRPSIPVTVRVGATIYRLVKGADYYEVADKFGIGESSVHEIIGDCVPAIVKVFGHYLCFPHDTAAMEEISKGFYQACGLPNCQGALGSCHVEIISPSGPDVKYYCNNSGHFSIVLQAVCDTSLLFLDVFCGFPGSASDAKVLHNSGLYEKASAGQIMSGPIHPINGGFQLRPYLLGSAGFPLCPWLMTPYEFCYHHHFHYSTTTTPSSSPPQLSYSQEQFNTHHERGRKHTKHAFAVLKRVFRVLGNGIRGRLELAPTILHACCILYNIMVRREDLDVKYMALELQARQQHLQQQEDDQQEGQPDNNDPEMQHEHFIMPEEATSDASSVEVRNQLAEFLVWDG